MLKRTGKISGPTSQSEACKILARFGFEVKVRLRLRFRVRVLVLVRVRVSSTQWQTMRTMKEQRVQISGYHLDTTSRRARLPNLNNKSYGLERQANWSIDPTPDSLKRKRKTMRTSQNELCVSTVQPSVNQRHPQIEDFTLI